jgi:hypothetical protein
MRAAKVLIFLLVYLHDLLIIYHGALPRLNLKAMTNYHKTVSKRALKKVEATHLK